MNTYRTLLALAALACCTQAGFGLATDRIGADRAQRHPTHPQPGWAAGLVKILQHDSRVYSIWVNGNENFYFKSTPDELSELINLFSAALLRRAVQSG
ncbi:MAG: hypothetical protein VCA38_04545 [Roseibacillus sp.]|jgi:hypothetical protein